MLSKINISTMLVTFISGLFIFGTIAYNETITGELPISLPPEKVFLLYGFLGGWLISGIFTAIILYITWLNKSSMKVKILSIIVFPFTMMIAIFVGIWGCLPCLIYNSINKDSIHKNKKEIKDKRFLYEKQKEITNICLLIIFILSIIIILLFQKSQTLLPVITVEGFMCIFMITIGAVFNLRIEKKIDEILLIDCDAKLYVEIMEYGNSICDTSAELRVNGRKIRQVLGCFLCGEKERGVQLLKNLPTDPFKYRINEQKYFYLVQIVKSLLFNELEGIGDYIERYTITKESIIKKQFWQCAILFIEKKYDELEPLIFEFKDDDNVLLKQYITYMQAEIFYKKGELDTAKKKFKFVCENGGTLEIVDICKEAIKSIYDRNQ